MTNANRPILNLDLDLLRTFVAVADLNTFAAAAAAVPTLADYATALSGHLGPGATTETPGSTPAKLPAGLAVNGLDDLNGLLEEGEDSTADILSPGALQEQLSSCCCKAVRWISEPWCLLILHGCIPLSFLECQPGCLPLSKHLACPWW